MKLTAIILLIACMQVSARTGAQTVTLSLKNASLEKVFNQIKKQTGYSFVYNNSLLEKAKKVTIDVRNGSLEEVLEACFREQSLTYEIIDRTIVVKPKEISGPKGEEVASLLSQQAPPIDVKGRVVNENGEPLIVTVMVKGTKIGTTTNVNGEFQLTGIDEDAVLLISGVSIEPIELTVANNPGLKSGDGLTITAKTEITVLNEVIINKGYYTEKQKLSVSNVGRITAAEIEKQPVSNPLLALQGRVPGLVITQNTGVPGGGVTVRIQGQNSIRSGSDPLYVIDGVPYFSQLPATGFDNVLGTSGGNAINGSVPTSNPLNYINPSDIENIDVLKDADATAIYGSRAANGAILITTKKGKSGKAKIDINLQKGWGVITGKLEMLNTRQYLDMRYEALKNDGIALSAVSDDDLKFWDTTRYTDWHKTLIGGTAQYTNINASVSGGTSTIQYRIGGTYHRETTVFPGDFSDQKSSVNFSVNSISPNQKIHFLLSGSYMVDKNILPNTDFTSYAIVLEPNAPSLYNADGTLNWMLNSSGTSTWNNPLRHIYQPYENKSNNLIGSAVFGYKILPGLEIRSSFGYTNMQTNDFTSTPMITVRPENRTSNLARNASYGNRNINSWLIEPQANYIKIIGKNKVDILVGGTIQQNKMDGRYISGSGYANDAVLKDVSSASSLASFKSFDLVYKYNAIFSRINFNRQDKYIINLTARRDGSSRFGSKNQFHNFGSLGAAWVFSNEKFIQKSLPFLSFGKLRGSYGTTGNDQIGDYQFMNLYRPRSVGIPYQNITTIVPSGLPNPYLQWEETKKFQFGIDLGLLSDRILLSTTVVRNRSSNQLLNYVLPPFVGFPSILENFPATVQNTALEFSLNTINIRSNGFTWESNLNFTKPKNKVVEFPNIEKSSYASGDGGIIIGQPIGIQKVYHFVDVDPATGKYRFKDINGNTTSTPNRATDRTVLINILPKFYGGFQNKVTYKEFQLDFLFQFVKQTARSFFFFNPEGAFPGEFYSGVSNQPLSVLDRWQKPGDLASIHKFSILADANNYDVLSSDYYYADASFIRLKNFSFSYQLPDKLKQKAHMQNVRIYVQGQNLLTISKYKGMDPENQSTTSLPPLRVWTMGIQIGL